MAERKWDEWLSDADALLWNIERDPILRSTIVAVGLLDRVPDHDRVRAGLELATRRVPRLRQIVAPAPLRLGPPRWVIDPLFDVDYHFRWIRMPQQGPMHSVLQLARPAAEAAFDRNRPLWEFTIVEGLEGDKAAFILKVHHSLTDGVGGVEMAAHIFDFVRDPKPQVVPDAPTATYQGRMALARAAAAEQTRQNAVRAARMARGTVGLFGRLAYRPGSASASAVATARTAVRILAPVSEPLSPLMRERGLARELLVLDVPLAALKAAGKAAGGTLNDAYLAGVTGTLRLYHEKKGTTVEELRVTMPVNLRDDEDSAGGNKFTPARFPLPVGISDPAARMHAAGERAHAWAHDPALSITDDLAAVLNRLPASLVTELFGGLLKAIDFVATNVPGSAAPMFLGGAEIERFYPFAPPSGSSVAFGLLSHVDTCCIGMTVDTKAIPDPDVLLACAEESFAEIVALGASAPARRKAKA